MQARNKTKLQKKVIGALAIFSFLFPGLSHALCLKECQMAQNSGQRGSINNMGPSTNTQNNQADQRYRSHNFGDASTNVMGDMNIQVGHEKIEIKGMENSTNSVIDASISSTIILGNTKQ
ncbi:MAG: hypothetical protein HY542_05400 [Deltaproteobacteria bacterium]|nr:hypothetical protein [Deltaproteobacteria bacterium]